MIVLAPRLAALAGFRCGRRRHRLGLRRHRHRPRARRPRLQGAGARKRRRRRRARVRRPRRRRVPEPGQPFRAAHRRRPPARRHLEPLGRALRALRPDRLPRPALARPRRLADRAGRSRALPRPGARRARGRGGGLRGPARASPPTRRSAATRSSAGATSRASTSCTPGRSPSAATSWSRCAPRSPASATAGRRHRRARARRRGEGRGDIPASRVVLAAGGNASTRLLLLEQERDPARFGGADGPLGRFYMGHLSGQIADVVFENRALHDALDYHVDAHGSYVRRRLVPADATQEAERLANVAFWPVVPPIANAAHRSGPLVGGLPRALAGAARPAADRRAGAAQARRPAALPARGAPRATSLRDLPRTLGFAPAFLWRNRVAKMRLPGFFLTNRARRYGLEYHAEQLPEPREPADPRGAPATASASGGSGSPCASAQADAAAVVRAHAALEAWLPATASRGSTTTRPAPRPGRRRCSRTPGTAPTRSARSAWASGPGRGSSTAAAGSSARPGLYVVSTAVLPTSGQANPTLTAVQLGLRLADDLAARRPW